MGDWSFVTNHAHTLACIAADPEIRLREIAVAVGVQERAAHTFVCDLVEAGYLTKHRDGRRNRYEVLRDAPLRLRAYPDRTIGELLDLLCPGPAEAPSWAARGDRRGGDAVAPGGGHSGPGTKVGKKAAKKAATRTATSTAKTSTRRATS